MPGDQICSACTRSFPRNHYVGVGGRRCTRCAACRRTVPAPLLSVATPAPATFPAPSSPPAAPAPAPLTTPSTSAPAPAQPNSAAPSIWDASALPPPSTVDTSAHSRLDEQADTITQLAESVAEIRQLVLSLRQDLAQPAAVPSLPAAPAIPPPTGELQLRRLFPWISRELAQQVYDDRLPPHELGKLRNPAHNTANSEPERELGVIVNGVRVSVPAPSSADGSSRALLRLIPDARSFAQAWAVYAALRCTSENNPHLAASLNAFLVHIIDLDTQYYWSTVAEYVLTVCQRRFGHASASDWVEQDIAAWQKDIGGVPRRPAPSSKPSSNKSASQPNQPAATPSAGQKRPRTDTAGQVCFRFNSGGCSDPKCTRAHICIRCAMVSPTLRPSRPPDQVGSSPRQTQARSSSLSSLQQTQAQQGFVGPPQHSSLQQTQAQQGFVGPPQHSSLQQTQAQHGRVGPPPSPSPQQTQARLLTSVPAALDVPSADRCLSLLLALRQHSPPPRPNTTLARDVFDPDSSPARIGSMQTQLHAWLRLLQDYPDERFRSQVAGMIEHGCLLGYDGPLRGSNRLASNLPIDDAGHAHLRREIAARLEEGRLTIVGQDQPLVESPIGVVPKPRSSKLRTIHHLSHPRHPASTTLPSVNDGIDPAVVRIQYESIENLVDFVRANPHCRLWKGDLEDAFRHVVTAESDALLLGFQYDGTRHRENALTFGGSSSPFLFNLVAEFLHWVVASCLPQSWPVNHYLDDTFGAVPAEAPALALLPVRALALAAAALGLRLSSKKTFADLTRLEILGIDIDSAAQTVGITPERRAHILAQCRTLLSRGTADLFDMQRMAGLLQFVAQVFPCGKAFLRRLYDCTRRSRTSGRRRIPRPALAELAWWVAVLDTWHGTCILAPSPLRVAHVWTDACPRGYGAHLGLAHNPTAVFSKEVPRRHRGKNIRFLEALAVLEALRRFLPHWTSPTTVVVHVDNENVEYGLRSGSSRDPLTQRLIREIFGLCFVHNLTLHPVRVTSTDNVLADLLSRRQFARIRQSFPPAHRLLFSRQEPADQPSTPLSPSHPAWASPRRRPHSSGTVWLPVLETALAVPSLHTAPSAPSSLDPTSPAFQPLAATCSNGSAACPPLDARTTLPSTSSATSAPTTSTSAFPSTVSNAVALNGPSAATNESTELDAQEPSSPSPSLYFDALSSPSTPSPTSPLGTARSSPPPSPFPSPASCGPGKSSGIARLTQEPSCALPASSWRRITPSSPCLRQRRTRSASESKSSHLSLVDQSAPLQDYVLSPPNGQPWLHCSALDAQAPSLSPARPSWPPSDVLSPGPAWNLPLTPATRLGAARPRGLRASAPAQTRSSVSAVGTLTVSGATSTVRPRNAATSLFPPSLPSETAPSCQTAPPGAMSVPFRVSPLAPAPSTPLPAAQAPRRSIGGLGASEPADFVADPQSYDRLCLPSPVSLSAE